MAPKTKDTVPAASRAGHGPTAATRNGLMDNMSRRSDADALTGHYVRLDLNHNGVKKAYKDLGLEDHDGDYGVFVDAAELDPDTGIPETINVRLRDETHQLVTVPYDAVRPAGPAARR